MFDEVIVEGTEEFDARCRLCGYIFTPPSRGQALEDWEYIYCCYDCYEAMELLNEDAQKQAEDI